MQPKDSPEFQYTALAFGPTVGFIAGWLMLVADLLAGVTVALGFGGYLSHLVGMPVVAGALLLIAASAFVLYRGIRESVGLSIILTVIETLGLLFVIVVGLPYWPQTNFLEMPVGASGVWGATSLIFFAYLGFDELGNFAEEMRNPERDLPRALFLSMAGSIVIYVSVAFSSIGAAGWRELSDSEAPLALVVGKVLGAQADYVLSLIALAATANTALLFLVSASRSVYGMGAANVLPSRLARIGKSGIPVTATAVVVAMSGILTLLGDLAQVAAMTNAAVLLSFMMVNTSLPWLSVRGRTRHYGGSPTLEVLLPSAGWLLCSWLLLHTGWAALISAVGFAVLGLLVRYREVGVRRV